MSRFWEIVSCVPLLFSPPCCLSNLKHAPARELPLTARETVFSHLKLPNGVKEEALYFIIRSTRQLYNPTRTFSAVCFVRFRFVQCRLNEIVRLCNLTGNFSGWTLQARYLFGMRSWNILHPFWTWNHVKRTYVWKTNTETAIILTQFQTKLYSTIYKLIL